MVRKARLPAYAEGALWEGEFGNHPIIRWVSAQGPILCYWEGERTPWDGRIRIGGFVERIHGLDLAGVELVVVEIVGGAFPPSYRALATLDEMREGYFGRAEDYEPLGEHMAYPFVMEPDSQFAGFAQDAMIAGLAVDATGRLADDDQGLEQVVGLPLIMQTLTLLR